LEARQLDLRQAIRCTHTVATRWWL
jgi:hypothetical protein